MELETGMPEMAIPERSSPATSKRTYLNCTCTISSSFHSRYNVSSLFVRFLCTYGYNPQHRRFEDEGESVLADIGNSPSEHNTLTSVPVATWRHEGPANFRIRTRLLCFTTKRTTLGCPVIQPDAAEVHVLGLRVAPCLCLGYEES